MNMPLISIALTTYNGEQYINEQIQSILNQTYENIEIIICDDDSTDSTFSILSKYQGDKRVKIFRNKHNIGYIKNFEKALSFCTGDFIALSDQDDIWYPDKLKIMVNSIGNKSLIWSDASVINYKGETIASSLYRNNNQDFVNNINKKILFGNSLLGCTMLFKKSVLDKSLPFPKSFPPHDWWICLVSSKMKGIKFYPGQLIKWRRHGTTDTNPTSNDFKTKYFRFLKFLLFFLYFRDIMKSKNEIRKRKIQFQKIYEDLLENGLISEQEKFLIKELITMYKSLNETKLKIKGFKLSYKYRYFLFPEKSGLMKWGRLFVFCYI